MDTIVRAFESETHYAYHDLSFFLYFHVRGQDKTLAQKMETVEKQKAKLHTKDPPPLSVLLFKKTVKDLLTTDPALIPQLKVDWIQWLEKLDKPCGKLDKTCAVDFAKIPTQFIDQGINDVVQFFTEGLGPHSGTKIDVDRWFGKLKVYETMKKRLEETLERLKTDAESSEGESVSSQPEGKQGAETGGEEEEAEGEEEEEKQGAETGGGRSRNVLKFMNAVRQDLTQRARRKRK
jgi:hypothetical protein